MPHKIIFKYLIEVSILYFIDIKSEIDFITRCKCTKYSIIVIGIGNSERKRTVKKYIWLIALRTYLIRMSLITWLEHESLKVETSLRHCDSIVRHQLNFLQLAEADWTFALSIKHEFPKGMWRSYEKNATKFICKFWKVHFYKRFVYLLLMKL